VESGCEQWNGEEKEPEDDKARADYWLASTKELKLREEELGRIEVKKGAFRAGLARVRGHCHEWRDALHGGLDLKQPGEKYHAKQGWEIFKDKVAAVSKVDIIPKAAVAARPDCREDESGEHEYAEKDEETKPDWS